MKKAVWGIVISGLCLFSAPAFGTTWSGYSTVLPGTSEAARPELAGTVIAEQTFSLLSNPPVPSSPMASLDIWVLRESSTGTLDFYYQFNNPNDVPMAIYASAIALSGFDLGPSLDVDYRTDLPGESGTDVFAARGAPDVFIGEPRYGVWGLDMQSSVLPIFIHTSATDFQSGGLITDVVPITTNAFVPAVGGVPEPSTLLLLPLAMGASALRRRAWG